MEKKTQKIVAMVNNELEIIDELEHINKKQKIRNKVLQKMIEKLNDNKAKDSLNLIIAKK